MNSRFSKVYMHKELNFVWLNPFLAQGVYCLQYKHPAKALSMVVMLRIAIICAELSSRPGPQLHVAHVTFS